MAQTALDRGNPLVAQAPKGLLGPDGLPLGARDPFFNGMNDELADKGFLVTPQRMT
jgi:NADH-quinone oxidoreductase subunit B